MVAFILFASTFMVSRKVITQFLTQKYTVVFNLSQSINIESIIFAN